jgi:hypothetical protein
MKTNRGANNMSPAPTVTVSIAHSRYGTAQPQVEVSFPRGTHFRAVRAALYTLAAKIESATPARERWVAEVDAFGDECGRVYLELLDANDSEAKRGLALLNKVVSQG